MQPIGLLMIEHRLIERMVGLLRIEKERLETGGEVDLSFIDLAVDFFRTYADKTHHGKEEDILFRELSKKPLSQEHKEIMDKLTEDHAYARKKVSELAGGRPGYSRGDASVKAIIAVLEELVKLYPAHIQTEDKQFFMPSMEYFNKEEQEAMLQEFYAFDRNMIHERYGWVVGGLEQTCSNERK
ncbi:MAG: hemerythrin domain-containing protein [Candidatus Altiarchaeota archaeon]|nr:hemerythrin domain-containing protein [Candidatus Altiarchaeota archaeon]